MIGSPSSVVSTGYFSIIDGAHDSELLKIKLFSNVGEPG